jgi:hypothetical protein
MVDLDSLTAPTIAKKEEQIKSFAVHEKGETPKKKLGEAARA